ncbi:MAG: hypothetical protein BWK73_35125 [Thiothrix lacustris]|uniref:DUF927 domain-containing protein n=1 Tax=Thiothrix lacustris TaxID=525917 RepID=A0A1Y1QGA4_9GAMM|nr:MAG: hypothetical protein BWK73_35125 [Thiothrix lacustris]
MARRKERYILQTDNTVINGYEQAGTLENWRDKVSKPCAGNHRIVFGISASFAAPLLHQLDQQGFGVNFKGASSIGKTTVLRAAKSVMGDHAHIRTWRATASGLESVAAQHNDNVLFLDEMGEADPKEIGATAYMLANGQGKLRQTRSITLRQSLTWRLIYLSTGEVSLADMLAQAKQKLKAGQAVRVIDISADAKQGLGIFDRLPDGFSNGAEFADYLKDRTKQYHGVAFVDYMTSLTSDLKANVQKVRDWRTQWREAYLPSGADSQVKRVADSFATIAAGGELATDMNITGWGEGDAGASAAVCFNAWLHQRGSIGNQEETDILRAFHAHFEEHGAAKYAYVELRPQDDKTVYRMGYRDNAGDFFVLPSRFEEELCKANGFDKEQVIDVLIRHKYLIKGGDGRATITKRVYSLDLESSTEERKPVRVYHLSAAIVGGAE